MVKMSKLTMVNETFLVSDFVNVRGSLLIMLLYMPNCLRALSALQLPNCIYQICPTESKDKQNGPCNGGETNHENFYKQLSSADCNYLLFIRSKESLEDTLC